MSSDHHGDALPISVIIPAHNEEGWIGRTLESFHAATEFLRKNGGLEVEILVVDNASTDSTAEVARSRGARIVQEQVRNIGRVRNTGARASKGDIIVFADADVIVPEPLLWKIVETMNNPVTVGGAVDTQYAPAKFSVKVYLQLWRVVYRYFAMAQGACQFFRRDVFFSLDGYDETIYMGEDVELFFRLSAKAKTDGLRVCLISDVQVIPSSRKFDRWPFWRTLVWTHPIFVYLFRRQKKFWRGWYDQPTR